MRSIQRSSQIVTQSLELAQPSRGTKISMAMWHPHFHGPVIEDVDTQQLSGPQASARAV